MNPCNALVAARAKRLLEMFTVPILCGNAAIHEEITPRDERTFRPHQQGAHGTYFIRRTTALGGAGIDHKPVTLASWPGQFVSGQWSENDAGADGIDPRTTLTPTNSLCGNPQRVPSFGNLVGVERVGDLVRLQHR